MKGYQKERLSVNGSIEGMDMEPLAELASEGLLALSLQGVGRIPGGCDMYQQERGKPEVCGGDGSTDGRILQAADRRL